MLKVVRTPLAVRDLTAITDHIAAQNLTAALSFYDEVDRLLNLIASYPQMGELVENFAPGLRRCTMGDYLLFYRQSNEDVEVIRVLHGARQIDKLF